MRNENGTAQLSRKDTMLRVGPFVVLLLGTPWLYGAFRADVKLSFGESSAAKCDAARIPLGE